MGPGHLEPVKGLRAAGARLPWLRLRLRWGGRLGGRGGRADLRAAALLLEDRKECEAPGREMPHLGLGCNQADHPTEDQSPQIHQQPGEGPRLCPRPAGRVVTWSGTESGARRPAFGPQLGLCPVLARGASSPVALSEPQFPLQCRGLSGRGRRVSRGPLLARTPALPTVAGPRCCPHWRPLHSRGRPPQPG